LNATVRGLTVGAKGDAEFAAAQGHTPLKASWKGAAEVTDLNLQDRVNRADFLSWKKLGFTSMAVSLEGNRPVIDLGDVTLEGFYGNVLLNQEGRLNVMDLVAEPGKAGGSITQDTQTRSTERPAAQSGGAMPDISVHSITLKDGRATFNDRFVKPNYTAELSSVAGSLSQVSSSRPQPAKVSVTGRVYRTAPLSISGMVQPFNKFLSLDLKVSAKGVDLPRFNTYASKYIGYPIKRGKLSLDVEYRIKDRQLQASNKVLLTQLTFGDKTNSPDATSLPVMLAVSLLRDRHGNIDLDLPISGSLDDPHFSVGGIILQVIGNLVVKAVTSPFSLLASAFGGGEELSYVEFQPGSAALDDSARDRIDKLKGALSDRPGLKLDVSGYADPQTDADGLRQAWVDGRIRAARDRALGKNAKPDAPLSDADRAKYLEAAYDSTKMDNKPRNFIGMSKSLPANQMEDLMRQAAPVGDDQLRRLADARAQAVFEALQADGGPADRVFIVAPELGTKDIKDDGKPNRVAFSLK
jgi:flagellar motor protein MotB